MRSQPSVLQALRSVRRFGWRHGLANCVRVALPGPVATLTIRPGRTVEVRSSGSDWDTFAEVFLDHIYSDDLLHLFGAEPASSRVRTVVDAGANVGFASVYFRSRYPNADVWAIEPDTGNYKQLRHNTSADS